uniref:Uncharacterized protein n=1 Tax=Neogobius melanostomus TaxID=47308 RepID=A0A8C6SGP1_9GOBI
MSGRPDSVPLQEGTMSYPNSGQFQYSVLEVHREMPKDHFIWSLLCFIYCNPCCLGLAALIHSVKARDRKVLGDIEGAHNYASTARTLNIISTVLFCISVVIAIILTAVLFDRVARMVHSLQANANSGYGNSFYSG